MRLRLFAGVVLWWLSAGAAVWAGEASDEFDRQRFVVGLEHEIAFRQAALQVAWGAEALCDDTTEIEPPNELGISPADCAD